MKAHAAKPVLFVALVHETLKQASYETRGDLVEAVKCRAARLRLSYDSAIVGDAIDQVERVRGPLWRVAVPAPHEPARPIEMPATSASDARAILGRLGAVIRTMDTTAADDAHARRVRDQAALVQAAVYRGELRAKRRPIRERLDAIFANEPTS